MWLVDSQCGIVGILLNFHMWTGVKNFRPESGVKFFIHEIFHTWNRCEFSIRHVQPCSTCEILNLHTFQTCFWCESGMKQAWSYENILYGYLNVLYQVCVFRADRKNKMAALASDWLRHFRLLLWNRWTEFNETWQEARSQRPLPSLCFSCRLQKQDGRPGLWLTETFLTSPLKPPNGIQRNLTGSKISTSSTKFVFFRPMSKQKFPPWLICQKGGTLYSGARYVALWASC